MIENPSVWTHHGILWQSLSKLVHWVANRREAPAFTPDRRCLTFQEHAAGDDFLKANIHVCDIETGKLLGYLEDTDWAAPALAVSPDGKLLMSAHVDETVRFWDLETLRLLGAIGNNGENRERVHTAP